MNSGFQKVKTLLFCSAVATLASAPLTRAEMASDLQDSVAPLLIEAKWTGAERQRTLTILHLAMFDAANATQGLYTPYAYEGEVDTSASAEAAVAPAALSVMSELMPEKQQDFEAMAAAALPRRRPASRAASSSAVSK